MKSFSWGTRLLAGLLILGATANAAPQPERFKKQKSSWSAKFKSKKGMKKKWGKLQSMLSKRQEAFKITDRLPSSTPELDLEMATMRGEYAFSLPGIGQDFVLLPGAEFVEFSNGMGRLTGELRCQSDADKGFKLKLHLSRRVFPGTDNYAGYASPSMLLVDEAYVDAGGPIDPRDWYYYGRMFGRLEGCGTLEGAVVLFGKNKKERFQVGFGANNKNLEFGASSTIVYKTIKQPEGGGFPTQRMGGHLTVELNDEDTRCAERAQASKEARHSGGHAFWIPGIARDFVFVSGGQFVEKADGSAKLTGVIASQSNPSRRFAVDVDFFNRKIAELALEGSPKKELQESAYVENGGDVDTATWHYYDETLGVLEGLGELAGARLQITRRGPSFQIGYGANGKNLNLGASGWFNVEVVSQALSGPHLDAKNGDINIDLDGDCDECASEALTDPLANGSKSDHAFWLPGIGMDFVFVAGGQFMQNGDGTAKLTGVVESRSEPGKRFHVDVDFEDRVSPGAEGYPPEDSPKRELFNTSYVEGGGAIDTSLWNYYRSTRGVLMGLGELEGAVLEIVGRGPAFQVGLGASGKNTGNGASGWFSGELLEQPFEGLNLPLNLNGDININLNGDCSDCVGGAEGKLEGQQDLVKSGVAFDLGALGDYRFIGGAQIIDIGNGSALLSGIIGRMGDSSQQFGVNIELSDRVTPGSIGYPPPASPVMELPSGVYKQNGGMIDTEAWVYYRELRGVLNGLEDLEGAMVEISGDSAACQLGLGANNRNLDYGAFGEISAALVQQPENGLFMNTDSQKGKIQLDVGGDCTSCPKEPEPEQGASATGKGGFAFNLPGIGKNFVFVSGEFREKPDGTATLQGMIALKGKPEKRFEVDILFGGRLNAATGLPPVGSPVLELQPHNYVDNGGVIDPRTWNFYSEMVGTLTGLGDFNGGVIEVRRHGAAFQVGVGANHLNLRLGATGQIEAEVLVQNPGGNFPDEVMLGDINLDLDSDCAECVDKAGEQAFWLPGLGNNYVFHSGGLFEERGDGSARLTGVIVHVSNPQKMWEVDVIFSSRVDPGMESYPPAGSPKMDMQPEMYKENGGPVETENWHYYEATNGVIRGLGGFSGAVIELDRMGPAFQVGEGASGKNAEMGASGWVLMNVLEQPSDHHDLPANLSQGDISIDIGCPSEGPMAKTQ